MLTALKYIYGYIAVPAGLFLASYSYINYHETRIIPIFVGAVLVASGGLILLDLNSEEHITNRVPLLGKVWYALSKLLMVLGVIVCLVSLILFYALLTYLGVAIFAAGYWLFMQYLGGDRERHELIYGKP